MANICKPEETSVSELDMKKNRNLIGIFDVLGRQFTQEYIHNQTVIYFYSDGSYEKRYYK